MWRIKNIACLCLTGGWFGCYQAKGASIGDVFLVSECAFHDRRIPIPVSISFKSFKKQNVHFNFQLSAKLMGW